MPNRFGAGCSCCDTCACDQYTGCTTCNTSDGQMARRWEFTVAGIANSSCSNCADYNGSWELCADTGCTFNASTLKYGANTCGGTDPFWVLRKNASDLFGMTKPWILEAKAGTSATAQYAITEASWDCCDDNVMALSGSTGGECTSWPSSITLSPCGDVCPPIACAEGLRCQAGTTPSQVTITIPNNFANTAKCIQCDDLEAAHVLDQVSGCFYRKLFSECTTGGVISAVIGQSGGDVVLSVTLTFIQNCGVAIPHDSVSMTWEKNMGSSAIDCSTLSESLPFVGWVPGNACVGAGFPCAKIAELDATWTS